MLKLILISFLIFMAAAAISQENPGDVWINTPKDIKKGDHFIVSVHVNTGNQSLAAFGIDFTIDGRFIQMDSNAEQGFVEAGPDWKGIPPLVGLLDMDFFKVSSLAFIKIHPEVEDLHILNIRFIAVKNGISSIQMEIDNLADNNQKLIGNPRGIKKCLTIGSNGLAGDVNQDGETNILDALVVCQYYVSPNKTPCLDASVADVNLDGSIDVIDALFIAQYYLGMIGPIPFHGTPGPPPVPTM